tara:strand:+ start:197 stop:1738 length:1542 start_codon:yes stop_codon:yes gene_type:complete
MSHNVKKNVLQTTIAGVVASIGLSGCTYQQTREKAETARSNTIKETKTTFASLSQPQEMPTVEVLDSFYIADGSKPIKYADPLPTMNVTMTSKSSMTMNQILERARVETGIPMRLVAELGDDEEEDVEFDELSQLPIMPLTRDKGFILNHNGSLESFLDKVAAQFDLSWKYENGQVIFFRYLTKTFEIAALPGETSVSANLSGGSGSFGSGEDSGGGNGGESETTLSSSTSVWTAFESNIPAMLSEDGKSVISEATGKIIVKDRPHIVNAVERYINRENKDMRKQVMVNVKVLSVSKNSNAGADINWSAISSELASNFDYTFSGGGNLNLGSGAAVLSGNATSGDFEGSEAALQVIDDNTDSTLMTNVFLSTNNGQPAPLQVVQKQAYIKSAGATTTETSTTTTIEQGTVNTGFSLSILPRILKDDKILLQYSINISELVGLDTVTSGDQTVQTPEINTRDFLQKVSVKSGDTLIISGFERVMSSYEKSIGGSKDDLNDDSIVIILTPVIIDR